MPEAEDTYCPGLFFLSDELPTHPEDKCIREKCQAWQPKEGDPQGCEIIRGQRERGGFHL